MTSSTPDFLFKLQQHISIYQSTVLTQLLSSLNVPIHDNLGADLIGQESSYSSKLFNNIVKNKVSPFTYRS